MVCPLCLGGPHADYEDGIIECRDALREQLDDERDRLDAVRTHLVAYRDGVVQDPNNVLRRIWQVIGEHEEKANG